MLFVTALLFEIKNERERHCVLRSLLNQARFFYRGLITTHIFSNVFGLSFKLSESQAISDGHVSGGWLFVAYHSGFRG